MPDLDRELAAPAVGGDTGGVAVELHVVNTTT